MQRFPLEIQLDAPKQPEIDGFQCQHALALAYLHWNPPYSVSSFLKSTWSARYCSTHSTDMTRKCYRFELKFLRRSVDGRRENDRRRG